MKFYSVNNDLYDSATLAPDYKSAREIGKLRLGGKGIYIKNTLRIYHLPYDTIKRCFRRVMLVPAKLCCGKGDLAVESIIFCDDSRELASVTMPGTRAAKAAIEELRGRIPDADFSGPVKDTGEGETA